MSAALWIWTVTLAIITVVIVPRRHLPACIARCRRPRPSSGTRARRSRRELASRRTPRRSRPSTRPSRWRPRCSKRASSSPSTAARSRRRSEHPRNEADGYGDADPLESAGSPARSCWCSRSISSPSAVQLHRASRHLAALADGLVQVRTNAGPLEEKLTTVAGALSALHARFERVDDHLRATQDALGD